MQLENFITRYNRVYSIQTQHLQLDFSIQCRRELKRLYKYILVFILQFFCVLSV